MPFGVSRSAQFFDKEILKYPQMGLLARSIVIDANAFSVPGTERTVVPAGTVMKLSSTYSKRMVKYDGSGTIQGILKDPIDLIASASAASEPAALYFHEAVFASVGIVDFTLYASALVSSMPTCKFL